MIILFRAINRLCSCLRWLYNQIFLYPTFMHVGKKTNVETVLKLYGSKHIWIGNNVTIGKLCWLAAGYETGSCNPILKIGNGCRIGNLNHIYATDSIIIENDVLTADKVYISDNLHSYSDITIPIHTQPIMQKKNVIIGEGSWIGEHVCIIGATVGKHCVIGANSVVTKDIPDYSVAIGVPARVIKTFNKQQNRWIKC